ncbi:MAG: ABC transporter permease [Candidatus Buchananbacteria bacterium]|nr:ABC transporter permease [Candidatus Buchananbacteria bacterium]
MRIDQSIKNSFKNLRAHKLRSFLTTLGMVIGIASVMLIMSIGAGVQSLILGEIQSVGSNLVGVLPGASDENGPPASVMGVVVTTLIYDDAKAIGQKQNVPHATAVSSYVRGAGTIQYRNQDISSNFTGTTASYLEVESADVAEGHFFDESDERGISRVAVLGSSVADDLFAGQDPIGKEIKIKKQLFKVIGVMKERGTVFFVNQDDQVFIPLETAQKILLGINHLNFIRVKIDKVDNLDQSVEDIKMTLRERHDITDPSQDDFSVRNTQQALDVLTQVTDALKFFLVAIAGIALLVGGIGIMNVMLVAVNERIKEIGLRKAVGATKGGILTQFLVETIVVSLVGGVIGILIGLIISGLVAIVINFLGYNWPFVVPISAIILASSFSLAVGLIFGLYPAWKAAKLDPITALRYE